MTLHRYFGTLALAALLGFACTRILDAELRGSLEESQRLEAARVCARHSVSESDFRWCYESRGLASPRWRP